MNRRGAFQSLAAGLAAGSLSTIPAFAAHRPQARRHPNTIRARDGVELAWADYGSGPAMLLVHSWSMNSGIFRHQIRDLAQRGYRIVTYDRRGHGRSQPTGRGYDMDTLAEDLGCVIEQLGLSDAVLVGHSMGGAEAAHYVGTHGSQRVKRLVLLAPTTPCLTRRPDNPAGIDASALAAARAAIAADFPKWAAEGAAAYFRTSTSAETVAWGMRMLLETPTPVALACAEAFMMYDFRPSLAKIRIPTLVIHGDADRSAPLALTGRRTAEVIAGARLVVLEGTPHGLYETDAARVNQEIAAFAAA